MLSNAESSANTIFDRIFEIAVKYSERFDPVLFLSLLPTSTPAIALVNYFKVVMETLVNQRHNLQVCPPYSACSHFTYNWTRLSTN